MSASAVASDPELVRAVQERAARALPAEQVEHVEGWWLRCSTSCAWWISTVLAHGDVSTEQLERRIVRAERFYAQQGVAAGFQVSPLACPPGLDAHLAERGYRYASPMSLQVAATSRVMGRTSGGSLRVHLDDEPTSAWFEVWRSVLGRGVDPGPEWDLLGRVRRPSAYASALLGDEVVAVGRVVADGGWAGVFGMATLPEARGRGAARRVLAALASWADAHDAYRLYLQVEHDNAPAVRLYETAGFNEAFSYHYSLAP